MPVSVSFPSAATNPLLPSVHPINTTQHNTIPPPCPCPQAASPDPLTVRGAMLTANSIMKRFRYLSMKNEDSSLDDLIVCLGGFQEVLLHVFRSNWAAVEAAAASPEALRPLLETQRLMCRIFYSLNWQDLPEYVLVVPHLICPVLPVCMSLRVLVAVPIPHPPSSSYSYYCYCHQ